MKPSKPRPVSMMIPRNNTFGTTEVSPKSAEAPEARATAPREAFEVARPRVVRALTPNPLARTDEAAKDTYSKPPYADVPKVKAKVFNFGDALFTDGHKRLIGALRDECTRLHGHNAHLKTKLNSAAERADTAESECRELRDAMVTLKMQNTQLTLDRYGAEADLKQANDTLAEVDALFAHMRNRATRRHSIHRSDSSEVVLGEAITRPRSPTPNAGHGL